MNNIDDGGPAFPCAKKEQIVLPVSLRDYFAAQAIFSTYQSAMSYGENHGYAVDWRDQVAKKAYEIADAMLKAREL